MFVKICAAQMTAAQDVLAGGFKNHRPLVRQTTQTTLEGERKPQ